MYPQPPPYVPQPPPKRSILGPLLSCMALGFAALIVLAFIGSVAGPPAERATPTSEVITPAPIDPVVAESPTTTEFIIDAESSRALFVIVMCDQVGTDGFGTDWCSVDSDNPAVVNLIGSACELLDMADPFGTATEEKIQQDVSLAILMQVNDNKMTTTQGTSLSAALGATLGAREELCT